MKMQVSQRELDCYFNARKKILENRQPNQMLTDYSKYSIKSWKLSKLPLNKYLYIADFIDKDR